LRALKLSEATVDSSTGSRSKITTVKVLHLTQSVWVRVNTLTTTLQLLITSLLTVNKLQLVCMTGNKSEMFSMCKD